MKKFFNERIDQFKKEAQRYSKESKTYTIIRITLFVVFLTLWIFLLNEALFTEFIISVIIFPFIFGYFVNRHRKINYKHQFNNHLVLINEEELNRLNFKPQYFYNGSGYIDEKHPYSSDLDIYGPKSLYHYINRTATPSGENALADWLIAPAEKKEILKRQESIKELKDEIDWRQEIQSTELKIKQKDSMQFFFDWLQNPSTSVNKLLLFLFPPLMIAAITLWIMGVFSFYIPVIILLINGVIIATYSAKTQELSEVTGKGLSTLKKYRHILTLIEKKDFKSDKLLALQHHFNDEGYKASVILKRMERILEFLDSRSNMFYHILNMVFLIDLHVLYQAEKWRTKNKAYVSKWFDAIGEIEALSSFAGLLFAEEKNLCFPEIRDEEYVYNGENIGHPLINPEERVSNNYHLEGKGAVHIITGSNMSGKSTFLRTVAINAVMAYAGAPVCAGKLSLSIMKVFTSMRTHDDLEAHVSSFYAELKRIRQLLEKLENDKSPYLFALDEILKGTNSHDRHTGAAALVRQLHKHHCMGMVSTHDLELGALSTESTSIDNYSFNSDIIDDKIIFDYKIHNGVCRSFNASKLMEQMGIKINN